jgi:Raf kinase inhibitor-like YbhB/YbcL family protein
MEITSPEFRNDQLIPGKFTCEGKDMSPTLEFKDVPPGTRSMALIVDDPDAPVGTWVHWVVYNMPVLSRIEENTVPGEQGINDFGRKDYGGPCPPSGTHRYFFKVYALDTTLEPGEGVDKKGLEKAMKGHVLEKAELVGLYKRGT